MISHSAAVARLTGKAPKAVRVRKPPPKRFLLPEMYRGGASGGFCAWLPIYTISESNTHAVWKGRYRRRKLQRETTLLALQARAKRPALPCEFELTRIAPRKLDDHDNLRDSLKGVADAIAEWLGVDDSDPRLTFAYDQERDQPFTYGVRISWGFKP